MTEPRSVTPDLLRGLVSRRTALVGMGIGIAGLLAGCDKSSGHKAAAAPSPTPTATDLSDSVPVVNWSYWPDYIDVDDDTGSQPTLDAFTKQTQIKVNYTEDLNDNEEFFSEIQAQLSAGQDIGRD